MFNNSDTNFEVFSSALKFLLKTSFFQGAIEATGSSSSCRLDWIDNDLRKREELLLLSIGALVDRGRDGAINPTPPSEPDVRVSRIRLSSWMVTSQRRCVASVWLCQDYITKPTSRGGGTHRSSPRASNGRLDLWGSRSIRINRFQIVWFDTDSLISSFLPPLASSALPDFIATMEALTAVWGWHRANHLPRQLSPLTYTSFGTFPLQPCPNVLNSMITGGCHRLRSRIIAQA